MRPQTVFVSLLLFFSTATACTTTAERRAYVVPQQIIAAEKPELMHAVEQEARRQGWSVLLANHRLGMVEAVTPPDKLGDTRTREHWYFLVESQRVLVRMIFEAKLGGSPQSEWISSEEVCADYGYVRERAQLARIEAATDRLSR